MPIIQDAPPESLPRNTVPLGSPFKVQSQVHTTGAAEDVLVRYSLRSGSLDFVGPAEFPARIKPTATLVEHTLTLRVNGGGAPAEAVITIDFLLLAARAVLSTSVLRVLV